MCVCVFGNSDDVYECVRMRFLRYRWVLTDRFRWLAYASLVHRAVRYSSGADERRAILRGRPGWNRAWPAGRPGGRVASFWNLDGAWPRGPTSTVWWTSAANLDQRLDRNGWRDGWLSLEPRVACGLPSGSQWAFRGSIAETAGSAGRLRLLVAVWRARAGRRRLVPTLEQNAVVGCLATINTHHTSTHTLGTLPFNSSSHTESDRTNY